MVLDLFVSPPLTHSLDLLFILSFKIKKNFSTTVLSFFELSFSSVEISGLWGWQATALPLTISPALVFLRQILTSYYTSQAGLKFVILLSLPHEC
jgi:hypothetical protein